MKIRLIGIGKNAEPWLAVALADYQKRLTHYVDFKEDWLKPKAAGNDPEKIKESESNQLLASLGEKDFVILLDDKGKPFSSTEFSKLIEKFQTDGRKQISFVIGGSYGFSETLYKRANQKISLSSLTFPHQLVRLIFTEQLFRAFSILRGEKYHH